MVHDFGERVKGYSDEFLFAFEVGYTFKGKLTAILRLRGLESLENGDDGVSGGMGGLYANNRSYTTYGPELIYSIDERAGISLAGGHSIDAPEPIFGLAVTGQVAVSDLKRNDGAEVGCELFLTKPLGVGLVTTAQKRGVAEDADVQRAIDQMTTLNKIGSRLSTLSDVKAMTDVTGFGLLGHLTELCEGSGVSAVIDSAKVPRLPNTDHYIAEDCAPGGTDRNFESYGHQISPLTDAQRALLCDPQTSGGLLVAVTADGLAEFHEATAEMKLESIGQLTEPTEPLITVN